MNFGQSTEVNLINAYIGLYMMFKSHCPQMTIFVVFHCLIINRLKSNMRSFLLLFKFRQLQIIDQIIWIE